jgi:plasmid stabilization system protein ParE
LAYRVEIADRARIDLKRIYRDIDASSSATARPWFDRLEAVILSLEDHPARGAPTPENASLRQVFHGRKPNVYRVIYAIDSIGGVVTVPHVRHGRRDAFVPR